MHFKRSVMLEPKNVRELVEGIDLKGARGCAAFNLRRASRAVSQLYDAALSSVGLRATQYAILVAVARTQPTSVGQVAALTLTDATTMTRNLRLLQRAGLIEVAPRGERREKQVTLTAKGARLLARATPVWREAQTRFVGRFGERKWSEIRRELELLAAIAAQSDGAPSLNKGRS